MLVRKVARPLLSAAFIGQGIEALRRPEQAAETARPAVEGLQKLPDAAASKVPQDPETFARIVSAVQIGGGLLLASGKFPRLASAALACTVVPGSLGGHMFWAETDPQRKAQQRRDFLSDVSLLGGLMIASVDTEGKPSLGWRGRRAAQRASEAVSAALPAGETVSHGVQAGGSLLGTVGEKVGHGLQAGAERGRELADVAGERVSPVLDTAVERGADLAETARKTGKKAAKKAAKEARKRADTATREVQTRAEKAQKRLSEQFG